MARHAFNPLEPRVAVYEIVSGFVAALAVGVAGAFASDKTTPKWLLVTLFFGGLALWAGAILWLFLAHRRLAYIASGRAVKQAQLSVESQIWGRLGVAATTLLTVATVVAFVLGVRPAPNFASVYDGQDPNAANCVDAAVTAPVRQDGPALFGLDGRKVGHLELRASPKCGTIWVKVLLDPNIAPSLKGQLLMLVMYRPADGARITYPLRLKGGTEGFSNMISAVDACVQGEGFFLDGKRRGPTASTACKYENS
jgi:hypothetical protein